MKLLKFTEGAIYIGRLRYCLKTKYRSDRDYVITEPNPLNPIIMKVVNMNLDSTELYPVNPVYRIISKSL